MYTPSSSHAEMNPYPAPRARPLNANTDPADAKSAAKTMNAYDTRSIAMSASRKASGPASPTIPAMIAGRNVTPAVGAWIPTALAVAPMKRTLLARSVVGSSIALSVASAILAAADALEAGPHLGVEAIFHPCGPPAVIPHPPGL